MAGVSAACRTTALVKNAWGLLGRLHMQVPRHLTSPLPRLPLPPDCLASSPFTTALMRCPFAEESCG